MKKNLFYLLAAVCTLCLASACSSDDDEPFVVPSAPVTFTGNNIALSIDGTANPDATVTFTPDAANADKGTITLKNKGVSKTVAGENDIIPGTETLVIPVDLNTTDAGANFAGRSETEFYTFNYQGNMTNSYMKLSIFDLESKVLYRPANKTAFTMANGLTLTYNGNPLLGKMVTFTVDAADETKASLILEGEPLDLTSLMARAGEETGIATAGVFPGSPKTTLDIYLNCELDKSTFYGSSETEFCTFDYAGEVTDKTVTLNLTNVKLKNTKLAGTTWNVTEFREDDDNWGEYLGNPTHIVWDATEQVKIDMGFMVLPFAMDQLIQLMCVMPMIPNPMDPEGDPLNIPLALYSVLKNITFTEDGNIIAKYVDVENGATEPTESPAGMVQYVVTSDNTIKMFLNPQAIAANAATATGRADDATEGDEVSDEMIQEILSEILPQVLPLAMDYFQNGVPLEYVIDNNTIDIYLNTEFLLPILNIAKPLLTNETIVNMIIKEAEKDPNMGSMAPMLGGILSSLPAVIDSTTKVEIGLHLEAAN